MAGPFVGLGPTTCHHHPANQPVRERLRQPPLFLSASAGLGRLTYQWLFDGTAMTGATNRIAFVVQSTARPVGLLLGHRFQCLRVRHEPGGGAQSLCRRAARLAVASKPNPTAPSSLSFAGETTAPSRRTTTCIRWKPRRTWSIGRRWSRCNARIRRWTLCISWMPTRRSSVSASTARRRMHCPHLTLSRPGLTRLGPSRCC